MVYSMYSEDVKSSLITIFSTAGNWTGYGAVPSVQEWTEDRTIQGNDQVLVKVPEELIRPFQLFHTNWFHTLPITIAVYSTTSRARAKQMVENIQKMIKDNTRLTNYIQLVPSGITDNSYEQRNRWEYIIYAEAWRNDS